MVKFSKQMELQLVPEWRHKFCDYWQLKKLIKRIKLHKLALIPAAAAAAAAPPPPAAAAAKRSPPAPDTGTWTPLSSFTRRTMHPWAHEDIIKVHERKMVLDENGRCGFAYETEISEGIPMEEPERDFFKRLDEELNKVNQFFFTKEHEFLERAEILSRQLANLTQIYQAYNNNMTQVMASAHLDSKREVSTHCHSCVPSNPHLLTILCEKMTKFKGLLFSTSASSCKGDAHTHYNTGGMDSEENSTRPLRRHSHGDEDVLFEEQYTINIGSKDEEVPGIATNAKLNKGKSSMYDEEEDWALDDLFNHTRTRDYNYEDSIATRVISISSLINALSQRLRESAKKHEEHSIESLNKSNSSGRKCAYTLASQNSFKASMADVKRSVSKSMRGNQLHVDENCVSLQKIKHARKMLRTAFVEFYRGLGLLQTYSSLNILAFSKILKKFDKVTGRQVSPTYMKAVEKAHFNTSDKVVKMMDEVERLFTEQFAKDNEKKAMMLLRPVQNEAPHTITFFLGLFSGGSIALLMAFAIMLQVYKLHTLKENEATYEEVAYQVFGMLFLVLLQMYMYGCNVYAWRKTRMNYAFILDFAPKTELRHREIFLVCTGLTCMVAVGMLGHLLVYTSATRTQVNPDVVPLVIILVLLSLLVCPLDVFYRSSRVYFIKCMKRVIVSPVYKVLFVDFFLADQLTSQITALRSMQFVMCYYLGGFFQTHNTSACASSEFRYLAYLISFMPYWWRLMQCVRRWIEEGDKAHLINGGKYFSAMVAAAARITYSFYPSSCWLVLFVITSSFATLYQMYWDIVRDWGLFQPHSRNPWLRDELVLKNKSIYYFSIALNFVLRFAWLQQVVHWEIQRIEHNGTDLVFAALEVIRRGHWSFYRLEHEHVSNVGKYRVVKLVPLPFKGGCENHV